VIAHVSHAVDDVPTSEAQVTASVISTAVTNYLYAAVVGDAPGVSAGIIYGQAHASVPAASRPAVEEHLPRAFGDVNDMYSLFPLDAWSRDYVAAAVARAVAQVTEHIALLSPSELS
jgi:hypothetical protein